MDDMAEFFQLHEMVDFDSAWLTDAIHVIAGQVYQHYVLCTVLLGRQKYCTEFFILYYYKSNEHSNHSLCFQTGNIEITDLQAFYLVL